MVLNLELSDLLQLEPFGGNIVKIPGFNPFQFLEF